MPDFLLHAALAGVGLAAVAGPLGCFVVWRRMAYFGDATAHAAILGVALALATELSVTVGVLITSLLMALGVTWLSRARLGGGGFALDTLLGVAAHGALAVGLVAVALGGPRTVPLESFLFGEILAVNRSDLLVIWGGAGAVLALLVWRWRALLSATLNSDMASADGHDPGREELVLAAALALLVALGIKVVGALLLTAMLIIPAATARPFARTPELMAFLAVLVGTLAVLAGLALAFQFDTPAGPSIVATAAALFAAVSLVAPRR